MLTDEQLEDLATLHIAPQMDSGKPLDLTHLLRAVEAAAIVGMHAAYSHSQQQFIDASSEVERLRTLVQTLHTEVARSERRAIMFGDCMHNQVLAMRAAVVDGVLQGPEAGMGWIVNTLAGPGQLPDIDAARALGGAQEMFDSETAEHEAFRRVHPGPGPTGPNVAGNRLAEGKSGLTGVLGGCNEERANG